jgi:hypothetical protein
VALTPRTSRPPSPGVWSRIRDERKGTKTWLHSRDGNTPNPLLRWPPCQSTPSADPDRIPARVLSAIALASIAAGTIHIAAAATLGSDSAQNLAFFAVVAAAQIAWARARLPW